jgi:CBS domain containing-hemolysin-like protein
MEEVAEVFEKSGYSRLPVYKETIDNVIGLIHQRDFFLQYVKGEKQIGHLVQEIVFTSEYTRISTLLKQLQKQKIHMAAVSDEYGGLVGIVTLEDILEELVGEIWDEHDEVINEIEKVSETEYIVHGSTNLEDLFEALDMGRKIDEEVEEMEVVTVSGWVMEEVLERIPAKGDVGTWQNLEVTVLEMDENRVEKIKLVINEEAASEE